MKNVGVICEYNPFHGGHAYLLERVRGAETVICLMSGEFTQRGEAAILPPVARAEMALRAGADLVLELPFPYCAGSARYFATAGVDALARLGADTLAFGSESADLSALLAAAEKTMEPEFLNKCANGAKNKGDAANYFEALGADKPLSNDILAIEYIRAAQVLATDLAFHPVLRVGAGYRDTALEGAYPSATALRQKLTRGEDITGDLPESVRVCWQNAVQTYGVADTARLGASLLALLRAIEAKSALTGVKNADLAIADCGGGLLERLVGAAIVATDYQSLCSEAATKKYTDGRIRRALLYLLAGVTYEDLSAPPAYLQLLGANERGRAFLSATRKTREIPAVTKPADIAALGEMAARQRALSAVAKGLYALCMLCPVSPADLSVIPPVML